MNPLDHLLAGIGTGLIATDAEGRVTRINAVAEKLTGWRAAEAVGQSLWRVFDRVGRADELTQLNPVQVLRSSGLDATRLRHVGCRARDGSVTPVELVCDLIRSPAGPGAGPGGPGEATGEGTSITGMTALFRDVSRQSAAEAQAQRLAAVVASSADAIVLHTLDGRITDWNAGAAHMFGWTAAEAVGQPVRMLVPDDQAAEHERGMALLARGETVPAHRSVRLARGRQRREVSVTASPVRDGRGRLVGGATSARDLTHQRQTETALRASEARLRFALESAGIGDWQLELASGIVHRSPRFDLCWGLVGVAGPLHRDDLIARVHADDRAAVARVLDRPAATAPPPFLDESSKHRTATAGQAEFRVPHTDGSERWLRIDARPAHEEAGPPSLVGIVADVTAARSAEQARAQAQRLEADNRRVLETSRLKSQFMANMSHELRTPLNAVIGFAELLHTGAVAADSPRQREYLGHIASSGRHLLQVINDVLDLSKIEAGKFDFRAEALDLPALVHEVLATLAVDVETKKLAISAEVAAELAAPGSAPALWLDAARLKQVLFNYLSNAIKFTESGGRVAVRARAEGPAHWRLEVEDSGIGIAPDDVARLFVEFQQLDSSWSKRHQGTGLGLALVRRLVEAQQGRVGVRSRPGAGSVFYAVLPRHWPLDAAGSSGPAATALARHTGAQGAAAVLVAGLDPGLRDDLARGLAHAGVGADVAATAGDALRLAHDRRYAALALDIALPGTPGLDSLAELRAEGSRAASAAAPVRALGMQVSAEASTVFAVADVLAKPLESAALAAALEPLAPRLQAGAPVLVIDDDPMARSLMLGALGAHGVQAAEAASGPEALRRLAALQPAAVVLDLMMPGMDGFQVLHALRADPAWRELPVFVWTAMTLKPAEAADLAASAQALIDKGSQPVEQLVHTLVSWVRP